MPGASWCHVITALPMPRHKQKRDVTYTENFNNCGFHDSSMWYKPHQRYTGTLLSGYSELNREKSKGIHDFASWSYSSPARNISIWCYSILQIWHLLTAKIISTYSRFQWNGFSYLISLSNHNYFYPNKHLRHRTWRVPRCVCQRWWDRKISSPFPSG